MQNITTKQIIFLVLALLGAAGTWYFNLQMEPDELRNFFAIGFATPISSSLMIDLLVVIVTWMVWMIPEARKLNINGWIIVLLILLTFGVAFAFTFPLFMFLRERALQKASLSA